MSDALINTAKQPFIAYGEKDWDKVTAAVTPDFSYDEVASGRHPSGIDQVLEVWKGWGTAFPDSKATFHGAVVSGDTVILEVTWNGTQTGPMVTPNGEVPATGKTVSFRAISVWEVKDGKAASCRQYFDMNTLLSQLGQS